MIHPNLNFHVKGYVGLQDMATLNLESTNMCSKGYKILYTCPNKVWKSKFTWSMRSMLPMYNTFFSK